MSKNASQKSIVRLRYIIIFVMSIGVTCINAVPYSVRSYYEVFQEAMGMTNQELGLLMSAYGIGSMILYFPGGWLADKFSPRKMLAVAYFSGGALTFAVLMFPGLGVMSVMFIAFAVCCNLLCWGSFVKLTSCLGTGDEQGKMMGAREAFMGLSGLIIGLVVLWLGEISGSALTTYKYYIYLYGSFCFISAILVLILIKENELTDMASASVDLSNMSKVVKMPQIWLMGIMCVAGYTAFSAGSYLSPYLVEVYGASTESGTLFGLIRTFGFPMLGVFFGLASDKIGSPIRLMSGTLLLMVMFAAMYLIVPGSPEINIVGTIMMIMWGVIAAGMRSLYYVLFEEGGIPKHVLGSAIGLLALIAYTPDAYFYAIIGSWIDNYGVQGYNYMFIYIIVLSLIGIICGITLIGMNKKRKKKLGF